MSDNFADLERRVKDLEERLGPARFPIELKIDNCHMCPHCDGDFGRGWCPKTRYFCGHPKAQPVGRELTAPPRIPSWCPLPMSDSGGRERP